MNTLRDEIGGELETNVPDSLLKKRAKFWHAQGYAEVYVNDESLPRFEGRTPKNCASF